MHQITNGQRYVKLSVAIHVGGRGILLKETGCLEIDTNNVSFNRAIYFHLPSLFDQYLNNVFVKHTFCMIETISSLTNNHYKVK